MTLRDEIMNIPGEPIEGTESDYRPDQIDAAIDKARDAQEGE